MMSSSSLQYLSDHELWLLVVEGQAAAYGELYDRYWESLFASAYWHLHDKAAAKDVVQEVFLNCWHKRQQVQINESFAAYFRVAVRFKVLNQLKSEGARKKYEQSAGRSLPVITDHIDEHMAEAALQSRYHRELNRLPEKMREIFTDSRDRGLSIQEIASKRSISPQTVKNQLSAALKKLRAGLRFFFIG